jgi:hypothetical protein
MPPHPAGEGQERLLFILIGAICGLKLLLLEAVQTTLAIQILPGEIGLANLVGEPKVMA